MVHPAFAEAAQTPMLSPWPYSLIRLTEASRADWARFWTGMAACETPIDEARAEGDLAVRLWSDWMTAWADLSLMPIRTWAAAFAPPPSTET